MMSNEYKPVRVDHVSQSSIIQHGTVAYMATRILRRRMVPKVVCTKKRTRASGCSSKSSKSKSPRITRCVDEKA